MNVTHKVSGKENQMFVLVENLTKKYPGKTALDNVCFSAEKGKVIGILGPNGAGKSTLFRIIATVSRPSDGKVYINGAPAGLESRKITAYLPDINPYYDWMKVIEQFEFLEPFYKGWDIEKTKELLKFLDVPENQKIGTLSKGQQAKLKIAFAFSWPAELILMDEPFGGIDPPSRHNIMGTLFKEFRFGEQTIIISTHIVNEAEEFIEDVIYLDKGKIVLSGKADMLREERGKSLEGIFEDIAV